MYHSSGTHAGIIILSKYGNINLHTGTFLGSSLYPIEGIFNPYEILAPSTEENVMK